MFTIGEQAADVMLLSCHLAVCVDVLSHVMWHFLFVLSPSVMLTLVRVSCRNPMVTGTSVLGVKFTGGVIIAADMLGSYGSLARFRNISRLMKVTTYSHQHHGM